MKHDPHSLPPDLAALEQGLAAARPEPPAHLRSQVLQRVQWEQSRSPRRRRLHFAAAAAIVLLLGAHFGFGLSHPQGVPRPGLDRRQAQAGYRELREALPELPEEQAWRMSLSMAAGQNLLPYGPTGSARLVQPANNPRWNP